MRDQTNEALDAVVKMSPPAAVTIYSAILDMPVEKWVSIFTLIYVGLQVILLLRDRLIKKRRRTDYVRRRRAGDNDKESDTQ